MSKSSENTQPAFSSGQKGNYNLGHVVVAAMTSWQRQQQFQNEQYITLVEKTNKLSDSLTLLWLLAAAAFFKAYYKLRTIILSST